MLAAVEEDTEFEWPAWAEALYQAVADAVEFHGLGAMEGRYYLPDESVWGVDLVELAPALAELVEVGPNDGEHVWASVAHVDLLAVQAAFDQVDALSFGIQPDGQPSPTVEGKAAGNEVVVLLHTHPFGDAEPDTKLDRTPWATP